jgi:tetratricopeptide (TPR) repeat protein/TolB-like protein
MVPLNAPLGDALIVVSLLVLLLFPLPGWAETWKEAYQKGLDLMAAQRWEEAARAFDRAIQGNPREDGTIRLYGMRYGYFPYRNKGIALSQLGQWEAAMQALEESLRQGFSEEGASYLERARKHLSSPPGGAEPWQAAYLKGLDFMAAQRWQAAVQAFDQAIQGNPREDGTVRLYGLHYGYFPHRNKGIALSRLGRWEDAIRALEESLRQGFSEEATSYLERARARQPVVELPRIFRGTWWDYYERGLLYGERGLWNAAIKDFQAALKARGQEDRVARTYGVSFLEYFPQREMGVALYYDAQYTAAVQTLERSLATAPTAKAAYYLNVARAALLRQSRPDPHPPQLTLTAPRDGLLTNLSTVEVQGTAESKNFVAAVAINGEPLLLETAAVRVPFAVTVPLASGPNVIEVVARDLIGNETTAAVRVLVDREGPVVAIQRVGPVAGGRLRFDGTVSDNTRLDWLQVNGRRIPLSGTVESRFSAELPGGGETILIEAADTIGNLTRARLPIPAVPRQRGSRQPPQAVPVMWPSARPVFFHTRGPPTIDVESLPAEVQDENLSIGWSVTAVTALATVKINEEAKTVRQAEASTLQIFSHLLPLLAGENIITISAVDRAGQKASKTVKVIRKTAEVDQIGSRLSVAVLPFQPMGQVPELYQGTYQAVEAALVNQRRFRIVDRVELEKSLKELRLSQTELVDQATAVRVGKLAAAEAILMGTVREYVHASTRQVEILVRLVNTETSTVLVATGVFDPDPSPDSFRQKMRELTVKLREFYPLVNGLVIKVLNRRVAAGLGGQQGVRPDMKVIVYLEGEPLIDPQTQVKLGQDVKLLGEGLLDEVQSKLSFCCAAKDEVLGLVQHHVDQGQTLKVITK